MSHSSALQRFGGGPGLDAMNRIIPSRPKTIDKPRITERGIAGISR